MLRRALADDYKIAGVDARRGRSGLRRFDMARLRHAERVVDGADVVIDLASAHWKQSWEAVRVNNIPAAWNTLEAARRRGVRRVIYASSNHVTGLYERDEPYARILAGGHRDGDPPGQSLRRRQGIRRGRGALLRRGARAVGALPTDRHAQLGEPPVDGQALRHPHHAHRHGASRPLLHRGAPRPELRPVLRRIG